MSWVWQLLLVIWVQTYEKKIYFAFLIIWDLHCDKNFPIFNEMLSFQAFVMDLL